MFPSLRRITRRIADVGPGLVDTFLRDNRVLPAVLALLALLVFAWVVAGTFVGDSDGERVANQANVAQSQNAPEDPLAPEAENRDVDSYAAYRNKDPFRQLLAPAESTSDQPAPETTTGPPAEETVVPDDAGDGSTNGGDATSGAQDTDNDGLTDTREAALAQDPQNPDTDGDGIPDGADDADGDGQPDGRSTDDGGGSGDASASPNADSSGAGNNGGGSGTGAGGAPDDASAPASDGGSGRGAGRDGGGGRRGDDLLDSGGNLYAP